MPDALFPNHQVSHQFVTMLNTNAIKSKNERAFSKWFSTSSKAFVKLMKNVVIITQPEQPVTPVVVMGGQILLLNMEEKDGVVRVKEGMAVFLHEVEEINKSLYEHLKEIIPREPKKMNCVVVAQYDGGYGIQPISIGAFPGEQPKTVEERELATEKIIKKLSFVV